MIDNELGFYAVKVNQNFINNPSVELDVMSQIDGSNIAVYLNGAKQDNGYSVVGDRLVFDLPLNIGDNVVILRDEKFTQEGNFNIVGLTEQLDKMVKMSQQLKEAVNRALKLEVGEDVKDYDFSYLKIKKNGKVLAFDNQGKLVAISTTDLLTAINASGEVDGLLDRVGVNEDDISSLQASTGLITSVLNNKQDKISGTPLVMDDIDDLVAGLDSGKIKDSQIPLRISTQIYKMSDFLNVAEENRPENAICVVSNFDDKEIWFCSKTYGDVKLYDSKTEIKWNNITGRPSLVLKDDVDYTNIVSKAHEHNNKSLLDMITDIDNIFTVGDRQRLTELADVTSELDLSQNIANQFITKYPEAIPFDHLDHALEALLNIDPFWKIDDDGYLVPKDDVLINPDVIADYKFYLDGNFVKLKQPYKIPSEFIDGMPSEFEPAEVTELKEADMIGNVFDVKGQSTKLVTIDIDASVLSHNLFVKVQAEEDKYFYINHIGMNIYGRNQDRYYPLSQNILYVNSNFLSKANISLEQWQNDFQNITLPTISDGQIIKVDNDTGNDIVVFGQEILKGSVKDFYVYSGGIHFEKATGGSGGNDVTVITVDDVYANGYPEADNIVVNGTFLGSEVGFYGGRFEGDGTIVPDYILSEDYNIGFMNKKIFNGFKYGISDNINDNIYKLMENEWVQVTDFEFSESSPLLDIVFFKGKYYLNNFQTIYSSTYIDGLTSPSKELEREDAFTDMLCEEDILIIKNDNAFHSVYTLDGSTWLDLTTLVGATDVVIDIVKYNNSWFASTIKNYGQENAYAVILKSDNLIDWEVSKNLSTLYLFPFANSSNVLALSNYIYLEDNWVETTLDIADHFTFLSVDRAEDMFLAYVTKDTYLQGRLSSTVHLATSEQGYSWTEVASPDLQISGADLQEEILYIHFKLKRNIIERDNGFYFIDYKANSLLHIDYEKNVQLVSLEALGDDYLLYYGMYELISDVNISPPLKKDQVITYDIVGNGFLTAGKLKGQPYPIYLDNKPTTIYCDGEHWNLIDDEKEIRILRGRIDKIDTDIGVLRDDITTLETKTDEIEAVAVKRDEDKIITGLSGNVNLNLNTSDGNYIHLRSSDNVIITGIGTDFPYNYEITFICDRTTSTGTNTLGNEIRFIHSVSGQGLDNTLNKTTVNGTDYFGYSAYPNSYDVGGRYCSLNERLKYRHLGNGRWELVELPRDYSYETKTQKVIKSANGTMTINGYIHTSIAVSDWTSSSGVGYWYKVDLGTYVHRYFIIFSRSTLMAVLSGGGAWITHDSTTPDDLESVGKPNIWGLNTVVRTGRVSFTQTGRYKEVI